MKKITNYIVILAVIGMFLMTAVCALDLETQDFDGHFKMDVPKDASFEKMNDTYETGVLYSDEKNDINILYTDNSDYAGNLPSFTAEAGTKMYKDGNYSVMEFPNGQNYVSIMDKSHLVQIQSKMEVKDMESMLETVEF